MTPLQFIKQQDFTPEQMEKIGTFVSAISSLSIALTLKKFNVPVDETTTSKCKEIIDRIFITEHPNL